MSICCYCPSSFYFVSSGETLVSRLKLCSQDGIGIALRGSALLRSGVVLFYFERDHRRVLSRQLLGSEVYTGRFFGGQTLALLSLQKLWFTDTGL